MNEPMKSFRWKSLFLRVFAGLIIVTAWIVLDHPKRDSVANPPHDSMQPFSPLKPPDLNMALIDKKLQSLSGGSTRALDCGWVGIRENPNSASDCALRAFAHASPFYVRYNLQGIDSYVSLGLAGDAQGNAYFVQYDSMGWETGGLAKDTEGTDDNHILVTPCPNPVRLGKTQWGRLKCTKGDPSANRNIMTPSVEPY